MPANLTDYRVVVRRIAPGKFPYRWEIQKDGCVAVLHSSAEPYDSMQGAFEIGRKWLSQYVASLAKPARLQNRSIVAQDAMEFAEAGD